MMPDYITGKCTRCGSDIWVSDGGCYCREEEALDRIEGFTGYISGKHSCGHPYMEGCEEHEYEAGLGEHLDSIPCEDCQKKGETEAEPASSTDSEESDRNGGEG